MSGRDKGQTPKLKLKQRRRKQSSDRKIWGQKNEGKLPTNFTNFHEEGRDEKRGSRGITKLGSQARHNMDTPSSETASRSVVSRKTRKQEDVEFTTLE
jgi:hypothetical protein